MKVLRTARSRSGRAMRGFGLLALLLPLACDGSGNGGANRNADAESPSAKAGAQRIASLSPLATTLLLELDLERRLVAVDDASAALPRLDHRPRIPPDDAKAEALVMGVEADLVVLPAERIELAERLAARNVRTVLVLVHDFDDGFTLWNELAGRTGQAEAARERIAEASRPLSQLSAESYGRTRPRVAAIESFEPLVLVGDHRFPTALIEIAGGENVTHGRAEGSLPITRPELESLAPELLVHTTAIALDEAERRRLEQLTAEVAPLVTVVFDPAKFFEPQSLEAAEALHSAIIEKSRPMPVVSESASSPGER